MASNVTQNVSCADTFMLICCNRAPQTSTVYRADSYYKADGAQLGKIGGKHVVARGSSVSSAFDSDQVATGGTSNASQLPVILRVSSVAMEPPPQVAAVRTDAAIAVAVGAISSTAAGKGTDMSPFGRSPALSGPRVLFLFGSQTGTAQEIARNLHAEARQRGLNAECMSLSQMPVGSYSAVTTPVVVVVTSSTGDGEAPDNARAAHAAFRDAKADTAALQGVQFTMLGLGDSSYATFMGVPRFFKNRLLELGATLFYPAAEADAVEGIDVKAEPWQEDLWAPLQQAVARAAAGTQPSTLTGRAGSVTAAAAAAAVNVDRSAGAAAGAAASTLAAQDVQEALLGLLDPVTQSIHRPPDVAGAAAAAAAADAASADLGDLSTVTGAPAVPAGAAGAREAHDSAGGGTSLAAGYDTDGASGRVATQSLSTDAGAAAAAASTKSLGPAASADGAGQQAQAVAGATGTPGPVGTATGSAMSGSAQAGGSAPADATSGRKDSSGRATAAAAAAAAGGASAGTQSAGAAGGGGTALALADAAAAAHSGSASEASAAQLLLLQQQQQQQRGGDSDVGGTSTAAAAGPATDQSSTVASDAAASAIGVSNAATHAANATAVPGTLTDGVLESSAAAAAAAGALSPAGGADAAAASAATSTAPQAPSGSPFGAAAAQAAADAESRNSSPTPQQQAGAGGTSGAAVSTSGTGAAAANPSNPTGAGPGGAFDRKASSRLSGRGSPSLVERGSPSPPARKSTNDPLGLGGKSFGRNGSSVADMRPGSRAGLATPNSPSRTTRMAKPISVHYSKGEEVTVPRKDEMTYGFNGLGLVGVGADTKGAVAPQPLRIKVVTQRDEALIKKVRAAESVRPSTAQVALRDPEGHYSAQQPFWAPITDARYETAPWSDRKVLHVELSLEGSGVQYAAGDVLGVLPANSGDIVVNLLKRLQRNGNEVLSVVTSSPEGAPHLPGYGTLTHYLTYCVDLTAAPKKSLLRMLAEHCSDPSQKRTLMFLTARAGKDAYAHEMLEHQPSLLDLLQRFSSCRPPMDALLDALPPMLPRCYSITSAPQICPGRVQVALTVVRFRTRYGSRLGLASGWLDRLAAPWAQNDMPPAAPVLVPLFLKRSADFRPPADPLAPVIMIGPGTGVAPFRGFLQHRRAELLARGGSNAPRGDWLLFFGCRRDDEDYLYREDLEEFEADKTLSDLLVAFSRVKVEKVYVQQLLREHGARVAELIIAQRAHVFVCGDGAGMAKDVHGALRDGLRDYMLSPAGGGGGASGGLPDGEAAAEALLAGMVTQRRYVREVWS